MGKKRFKYSLPPAIIVVMDQPVEASIQKYGLTYKLERATVRNGRLEVTYRRY